MRPDRMGRSKWQKVLPWYYTGKRQQARHAARASAIRYDRTVTSEDDPETRGSMTRCRLEGGPEQAAGREFDSDIPGDVVVWPVGHRWTFSRELEDGTWVYVYAGQEPE